jgi:hypothetical protein
MRGLVQALLVGCLALAALAPWASADTPVPPLGGLPAAGTNDPVIAAAGDIACDSLTAETTSCHQQATANLLLDPAIAAVLPLGDEQYPDGSLASFQASYAQSWGAVAPITRPTPGNHEYGTSGAAGYFAYFGQPPYYSYDLGFWHLVSLNSEIDHDVGSAQVAWLRADLAAHPRDCVLAYWHKPRFSSGPHHSTTSFAPFWHALYESGADVVLGGHDHVYERFARQAPNGALDPEHGIREFVVGTGGKSHYGFEQIEPNSQARSSSTFGVLELTLHEHSYEWRFVPEAGEIFTDAGSSTCSATSGVGPPPPPPPPSPPPLPGGGTSAEVPVLPFGQETGLAPAGASPQRLGIAKPRTRIRQQRRLRRQRSVLGREARRFERALVRSIRAPERRVRLLRRRAALLHRKLHEVRKQVTAQAPATSISTRLQKRILRSLDLYRRAVVRARSGLRALALGRTSLARSRYRQALALTRAGERGSSPP